MQGIPPEGKRVYTHIGTGLANPTQVLARSTGSSLEIIEVVEEGDGDPPEPGDMYSVDESCVYKPESEGPF